MAKKVLLSIVLVLIIVIIATSGFGNVSAQVDGIDNFQKPSVIQLKRMFSAEETCEQTYGVLPCTSTVVGNLFLIAAYGFPMYEAAMLLSDGSDLLLEILGPGIIGGLILPMLGAIPDAMLILVSGLFGSRETAQNQILVGMGLIAGSTVMLLTLLWGSCVVVGKCDIEDSIARDLEDTKGLSLAGSGVTTDIWNCYAARIMILSVLPFIIVQLPQILHLNSGSHIAVLVALTVSVILLLTYCLYQVFQPWIQKRRLAYAKHKHVILGILKHLKKRTLGRLLTDEGQPNTEVIKRLFKAIDLDSDGKLSGSELGAFLLGIQFDEIDFNMDDAVIKLLEELDKSHDSHVDEVEFLDGIARWINVAKRSVVSNGNQGPHTTKVLDSFHKKIKKEHYLLGELSDVANIPKWIYIKAVFMLLVGTVIAAAFSEPLFDAVENFSAATTTPSFFISFIALPFATKSREAVSLLKSASQKKRLSTSLVFSEIYGVVTMNIVPLIVILGLVYARNLTWDFSSEVLIIVIVCLVMGLFANFRTTLPLWTCLVAYALFPITLMLVYVLAYVMGW